MEVAAAAATSVASELGSALAAKAQETQGAGAGAGREWEEPGDWRSKPRLRAPPPRHGPQHLHHRFQQMLTKTGARKAAGRIEGRGE